MNSRVRCKKCDFGWVSYSKEKEELSCNRCNHVWKTKTKMPVLGKVYKRIIGTETKYTYGLAMVTGIYYINELCFVNIGVWEDPSPLCLHEFWEMWEEE